MPYSHNVKTLESLIVGHGFDNIKYTGGTCGQFLYSANDAAIQRAFMPAGSILPIHEHNVAEIIVCISGNMKLTFESGSVDMANADVFKVGPHLSHGCEAITDVIVIGILVPRNGGYPSPHSPNED